ncbi:hypothetical protein D3OALGA1CA_13 [Olavius algarvensis associated proteobacterium Delta 3]|nr:hypothetical protein D3OALGA1CA_13 [Olavius algarvensis associated proteobacterium Delta 3]
MSTADYIEKLRVTFPLREPVLREIIQLLHFPPAGRGLDVGCGIGQPAVLLAEHLDPGAVITGVDISDDILVRARDLAKGHTLAGRVEFRQGSMDRLPFDENVFDWAWSVDCAGYSPHSRNKATQEMTRVVKPGGRIAMVAWSSQQFLAGHPRLEARLNATTAGFAPFHHGDDPKRHFLQTAGRLRDGGIRDVTVRTFAGDVSGPASHEIRKAMAAFFRMRWGSARAEVLDSDWRLFCRLSDPDSDEFLPDRQDYYGFFTYTVFTGIVNDYTNDN